MHTSTSTIRRAPIVLTVLLPIVMLAMPTIPAWADAADPAPIHMASSVRSFPKHLVPHRSFSEAVSTDVDGSWGGIETLDVPHTESPEEQATRIQAEQARQSEAASRAEPRTPAVSAPTTGDKEKPASDTAAALVSYALQYQGAPYVYGAIRLPAGIAVVSPNTCTRGSASNCRTRPACRPRSARPLLTRSRVILWQTRGMRAFTSATV